MRLLVDLEGVLSAEEALEKHRQGKFEQPEADIIPIEGGEATVWLHLTIKNNGNSGGDPFWILSINNPIITQTQFYQIDSDNPISIPLLKPVEMSGRHTYFRQASYKLATSTGVTEYLLRVNYFAPTVIPLEVSSLGKYAGDTVRDYFIYGLICGAILSLALYNFFLFTATRKKVHLYYVFYMLSFLAYVLCIGGHANSLLGLGSDTVQLFEWLFLAMAMLFSIYFCESFFSIKKGHGVYKLFSFYKLSSVLVVLFAFLSADILAAYMSYTLSMLGLISFYIVAIEHWRKGFGAAKYYIIAISFLALTSSIYIAWHLGLLASNIQMDIIFALGPVGEAILFAIAMGKGLKSLELKTNQLSERASYYRQVSNMDSLTGLYNKGYLLTLVEDEIEKTRELCSPLCFIILDVDNFKRFNDSRGHLEGDQVLVDLADTIRSCIRINDTGCRFGGEEFSIVLPDTNINHAFMIAERIRCEFEGRGYKTSDEGDPLITISLGIARYAEGESVQDFIARADKALYKAKHQGKNRVLLAEVETLPQSASEVF